MNGLQPLLQQRSSPPQGPSLEQRQLPPLHWLVSSPQALPHWPQFLMSLAKLLQLELQQVWPEPQAVVQAPQ
jgi:hypothetical protein